MRERDWETIREAETAIAVWKAEHPEYTHIERHRRTTYQHDLKVARLKRGIGYTAAALAFMVFCGLVLWFYPVLRW